MKSASIQTATESYVKQHNKKKKKKADSQKALWL